MKTLIFLAILSLHSFSIAQTTITTGISGRDCFGGSGLCGGVEAIGIKRANQKASTFYLVLNQDKLQAHDALKAQDTKEVLNYHLAQDLVLDAQTIKEFNLDPNKPVIKAGYYPIERINGQLKILFQLSQ